MFCKHAKASSFVWLMFDTTTRLASSSSPPSTPVQIPSVKGSRVGREDQQAPKVNELRVQLWKRGMPSRSELLVWIPE